MKQIDPIQRKRVFETRFCLDCGVAFHMTFGEVLFFDETGIASGTFMPLPKRCKEHRKNRRALK